MRQQATSTSQPNMRILRAFRTRGIRPTSATLMVPLVGLVFLAACGSSGPSASSSSSSSTPIVKTANNPKYGTILVDSNGQTLYTLTSGGKPVPCNPACSSWPALLVPSGAMTSGPGVGPLGKTAGGNQVTYQDYPLFRYSGDTAPGQANGNGVVNNGGTWSIIKPGTKPGTPITGP
jgi:predicted lipoprotein with Yx(FWY)xxD motif